MNRNSNLFFVCVFSCMSAGLMGMENYTQDQLVQARLRWWGKEERIGFLQAESRLKEIPVRYSIDTLDIAEIDASTNTIKTFLDNDVVALNYTEFEAFINDGKLGLDTALCHVAGRAVTKMKQLLPNVEEMKRLSSNIERKQ